MFSKICTIYTLRPEENGPLNILLDRSCWDSKFKNGSVAKNMIEFKLWSRDRQ